MSKLRKMLIGFVLVVILLMSYVFVSYYRSDLTREELAAMYITEASKFMKLSNGAEMHYRDEGNSKGPAIVLIHGGFGSLQNWEGWVKHLKKDFRLISMDLLGHGLTGKSRNNLYTRISNRDAIHELLQNLNITQYAVAGNSFGGGIALEISLKYPNEVEKLILVDSEGVPNGEHGYDASQFTNDKPVSPKDSSYTQLSFLESLGSKFIGPSVIKMQLESMIYNKAMITDDFVEFYGRILRYKGNREAQILMFRQGLYLVSSGDPMDLLPRLKEINCPTLIIQGRDDKLVPIRVSEKFKENIKNSRLAIINNAGHMPMIEKPLETAKVLQDFLNTNE